MESPGPCHTWDLFLSLLSTKPPTQPFTQPWWGRALHNQGLVWMNPYLPSHQTGRGRVHPQVPPEEESEGSCTENSHWKRKTIQTAQDEERIGEPGMIASHYAAQANLKSVPLLPRPPSIGITGRCHWAEWRMYYFYGLIRGEKKMTSRCE